MKILVTGGLGFIGSHIVAELVSKDHDPVIVDSLVNSDPIVYKGLFEITGKQIPHYDSDVRNTEKIIEILKKHQCEAVIHLAAYKSVGESVHKPLKYYDNNIRGLVSVLEAMKQAAVDLFIFSSSTTVYGAPDKLPFTEDSPVKPPTNPYGATKQMSEQIVQDTCKATNIRAALLRYFNPIGAHPSGLIGELPIGVPSFLMPFIMQTVAGVREKLVVFGGDYDTPDGSAVRDFVHVMDLADAHIESLEYISKSLDKVSIFNIGTGKGTSVLELVRTFEKVNGVKVPYEIGPRREGDVPMSYASPEKATKTLGWTAQRTLEDMVRDAWKWQQYLKKQGDKFVF
jgi:UDP-glucose 4-epimerase